ncbi:MAG: hypothetical protein ABWK53_04350 [Anaerolineales bacterium]
MCLLFFEIALFVSGLIALITAKFPLNKGIVLTGPKARIAGVILMLPIPLAIGAGAIVGVMMGTGALPYSVQDYIPCIEIAIVLVCAAGAYAFAYANKPSAQPPQEPPSIPPQEPPAVPPAP